MISKRGTEMGHAGTPSRSKLVVERRRPDAHHQAVPPSDPPEAEPSALFQNHDHLGDLASLVVTIKLIMAVMQRPVKYV